MDTTIRSISDALVAELKTAIESVIAGPLTVGDASVPEGDGWATPIDVTGDASGSLETWLDAAGAPELAKRVLGADAPPPDADIVDLLRELWTQAASAVSLKAEYSGVNFKVGTPRQAAVAPALVAAYTIGAPDGPLSIVTLSGLIARAERQEAAAAPAAAPARVQHLTNPALNAKLEVVLDIDLPLVVRFGRAVMTLKALSALGPGSIVDMGRSPDEPVEMLVGDCIIARGEVVIVGGNYGVRITDLVSQMERVRALEA
jgi:flagellar motor switch protein FliN